MFSTKEELEALLRTLDVWVIVFGVFVAIGVAGESIVGFIHFRKSSQLHRLQTTENLAQQAEIERLRSESASIRSETGKAAERAAHAEQQAAESNKIAEGERLARIKLEERMAWRRISSREHDALVSKLSPHAGAVVEVFQHGEIEANTFANDIIKTLRDSGWAVRVSRAGLMVPPVYGLQCIVNESLPAGRSLAAVLRSLPTANIQTDSTLPVIARINVALRPPP